MANYLNEADNEKNSRAYSSFVLNSSAPKEMPRGSLSVTNCYKTPGLLEACHSGRQEVQTKKRQFPHATTNEQITGLTNKQ